LEKLIRRQKVMLARAEQAYREELDQTPREELLIDIGVEDEEGDDNEQDSYDEE
jgi:hypothetical protein